jgi:hypothetical protein
MYIFIFLQIMLYLSKEERIEIILLTGSRNQREAAAKFKRLHPHREPITQTCISRLVAKFKETRSTHDLYIENNGGHTEQVL